MENKILLVVLAHPDDESFGMGGTLAKYAAEGVDVYLLCATKGEAGDVSPINLEGFDSIADLREAELRCAAQYLGLRQVSFLGYRDSGMPGSPDNLHADSLMSQPVDEVSKKIVGYIRQIKPEVIITFDPIGGYRHPDRIAVHKATVKAFYEAGDEKIITEGLKPFQPQKLYYHTFPRNFLRVAVIILKLLGKDPQKFGRNGDIDLESFAYEDFPINVVIKIRKFQKQKEKAGNCHISQGGGRLGGKVLGNILRIFDNKETYMQAYPVIGSTLPVKHDLFNN